ncbi:MAG: outer membrane beta-barrel protein [Acidobacteria bacterium]|nr:outer membrane beta-barrel protein [Acidobacteriota bacterium]
MVSRLAVCALFLAASAAAAQPRVTLTVDGGLQPAGSGFSDSGDLDHPTFGFEAGEVTTRYSGGGGSVFDGGLRVRVVGYLALGASVSLHSREGSASLGASLPHPFLFESPRRASLTVTGLDRRELAVHVPVLWLIPVGDSVELAVFGGPTIFRVTQDVVTGVSFTQRHPFDTVQLTRAQMAARSGTRTGFHAGVDVAYFFSELAGVAGKVRFSRAELDLAGPVEAGGIHATAGLRLRF